MIEEKQSQLIELIDELEIIFSVKDDISNEEIHNFIDKFNLLSEYDIRKRISEITGDDTYINNVEDTHIKNTEDMHINNREDTHINNVKNIRINNIDDTQEFTLPIGLEHDHDEDFKKREFSSYENNINEECSNVDKEHSSMNEECCNVDEGYTSVDEKYSSTNEECSSVDREYSNVNEEYNNIDEEDSSVNQECVNAEEKEKEELHKDKEKLHKAIVEAVEEKKYSFNENSIPEVLFIRGETKYGQLSIEWGWPDEIEEVLICHRMDKFPTGPRDLSSTQCEIKRCCEDKIGSYTINKASQGDFYFCVYTKVNLNGKIFYSQGQKRLVVNKEPSEIFYEIKIKKNIFGKLKSAQIVVWSKEKEVNLPQLTLVGKVGNMPLQKSDGESILNIDYEAITKDKSIDIELPDDKIRGNMYVKLFFHDDINSRLFRIVSPAKERLYFK
ncbi:hypothetical protein KQI86_05230 [Clostridium sp. MSJ-11]|uniref:GOLD domain-containing protein n=1 Tax=Clostridium mobile TaxID=2841512 RepID=A0ABS6EET2_9CLOT|nr:hypothetical protein [Clostridium mobile]MBU5483724.1 hypothetical protein [Clostridium mobile]